MGIEIVRIGQRLVRDDRVTTHVALVSRAFGAERIFMTETNPDIRDTLGQINRNWGGDFEVELVDSWRQVIRQKKGQCKLVHLTMYGEPINDVQEALRAEENLLVIVGAEKVPRDVYEMADWNVSIGSQPHSEISALAVFLDRIQAGGQFARKFANAKKRIVPQRNGKHVDMEISEDTAEPYPD